MREMRFAGGRGARAPPRGPSRRPTLAGRFLSESLTLSSPFRTWAAEFLDRGVGVKRWSRAGPNARLQYLMAGKSIFACANCVDQSGGHPNAFVASGFKFVPAAPLMKW